MPRLRAVVLRESRRKGVLGLAGCQPHFERCCLKGIGQVTEWGTNIPVCARANPALAHHVFGVYLYK